MTKLKQILRGQPYMPFEFFSAVAAIGTGLFLLTPFFHAAVTQSSVILAINATLGPLPFGLFLVGLGALRMVALFWFEGERSEKWRRKCATTSFITYLFFTTLRIIAYGLTQTVWVAMALLTITELLARLEIGRSRSTWTL